MMTMAINSLDILKRLKSVGFTEQQAEAHAQIFTEVVEDHLITKKDLEVSIKDIRNSMNELEYKLTIKMGAMLVAAVSILAIMIKLL